MRPDERSDAWGVCHELAVAVYRATGEWPPAEIYGLSAQARRKAVTAVVHVADDAVLGDPVDRHQRLRRALRALHFLGYILALAHELGYTSTDIWRSLERLRHRAEELIRGLLVPGNTPPRLLR